MESRRMFASSISSLYDFENNHDDPMYRLLVQEEEEQEEQQQKEHEEPWMVLRNEYDQQSGTRTRRIVAESATHAPAGDQHQHSNTEGHSNQATQQPQQGKEDGKQQQEKERGNILSKSPDDEGTMRVGIMILAAMVVICGFVGWRYIKYWKIRRERYVLQLESSRADAVLGDLQMIPNATDDDDEDDDVVNNVNGHQHHHRNKKDPEYDEDDDPELL